MIYIYIYIYIYVSIYIYIYMYNMNLDYYDYYCYDYSYYPESSAPASCCGWRLSMPDDSAASGSLAFGLRSFCAICRVLIPKGS